MPPGGSTCVSAVGEGEGKEGVSSGVERTVGVGGVDVGVGSSVAVAGVSVLVVVREAAVLMVELIAGDVASTASAMTVGVGVGVGVGWAVGGGLVGAGGGFAGAGVFGLGVRVGTVCRSGLCPGAAHRSGPAVNPTISIPNSTSQSMTLFIASSPPSEVKPELPVMIQHSPVDHPSPLHCQRLRRRIQQRTSLWQPNTDAQG